MAPHCFLGNNSCVTHRPYTWLVCSQKLHKLEAKEPQEENEEQWPILGQMPRVCGRDGGPWEHPSPFRIGESHQVAAQVPMLHFTCTEAQSQSHCLSKPSECQGQTHLQGDQLPRAGRALLEKDRQSHSL